jgi:hypothetical protein
MSSTAFGPPFDHANADTILQSSDEVDFYVYRGILSTSSSVLEAMFSLPQPTSESEEEESRAIEVGRE